MNRVQILCVGKLKESYLHDACEEYRKRLNRYCKLEITEVGEYRTGQNPGKAEIEKALEMEGGGLISKIRGEYVIALCVEGESADSIQLSEKLEQLAIAGKSSVTFIIGGSFGLSDETKKRADFKLSMSEMTFPHQLARVMLLEQVYRAHSISSNAKYHK